MSNGMIYDVTFTRPGVPAITYPCANVRTVAEVIGHIGIVHEIDGYTLSLERVPAPEAGLLV
ncbi:hypothetical protein ACQI5H_23800 [Mycobacterium heidelbergense]|uniref:hypothetical protein n=1 Tax=Mycobacterium heidelbergense TaxID=53376 RepID=UPI003CFB09DC